jgi:hypothetical protein
LPRVLAFPLPKRLAPFRVRFMAAITSIEQKRAGIGGDVDRICGCNIERIQKFDRTDL